MHNVIMISGMLLVCGVSACSQSIDQPDSLLDCAALISAANQLSVKGKLETDAEFDGKALVSSMTYLNAYAIPAGIREANAFEKLNSRRDELIDTTLPSSILDRAKACVRNTPKQ